MKCSTMMALAFCGVLAFAVTGCKYDDAAAELGGTGDTVVVDVPTDGDGLAGGSDTTNVKDVSTTAVDMNAGEVDLGAATQGAPFDQDPNFVRCTDVDFAPVYFGFDISALPGGEMAKVEAVANELKAKPNRVVIVEGNCDERGSNEYNLSLGDLRATAIRDYLVTLGVDAARIQTKSYGEEKPAVTGSGESVWRLNRRGEFAVFQHK